LQRAAFPGPGLPGKEEKSQFSLPRYWGRDKLSGIAEPHSTEQIPHYIWGIYIIFPYIYKKICVYQEKYTYIREQIFSDLSLSISFSLSQYSPTDIIFLNIFPNTFSQYIPQYYISIHIHI